MPIYLNTEAVLDKALTKVQDNTPELRAKALDWLNEVRTDIHNQPRLWNFMRGTTTLTVSDNAITLPNGVSEVISLEGDTFLLTPQHILSETEAYLLSNQTADTPQGYIKYPDNTIQFFPGATGSVIVTYEANANTDLADSPNNTVYPKELENLFILGVRMHYYDYDKDGRFTKEVVLYQDELSKVKAWDNQLKALPKFSSHGYIKDRA